MAGEGGAPFEAFSAGMFTPENASACFDALSPDSTLLGRVKSTGYFSASASYSFSAICGPVSSHVTSTCTECESSWSHARSWLICLIDAPTNAMVAHKPAIPPGLSGTTQLNRISRPSFTRPRSNTLPSVEVSMFPPHSSTATFLPFSSGSLPANTAAIPAAPAPS